MAKTKTTEQFVAEAVAVHQEKYRYDEVLYKGAHEKVKILCVRCNSHFTQSARKHLNGQGCPACFGTPKKTAQQFVEALMLKHGNEYDYSKSIYNGAHEQFSFECIKHGLVTMSANNHLRGAKCAKCAGNWKKDSETFAEEARSKHGDTYDYTSLNYIDSHTPLKIVCKTHDVFWQSPTTHLSGAGCPKCAAYGFNKDLNSSLYILSDNKDITKIGITNRDVQVRCAEISKSANKSYVIKTSYNFDSGEVAARVEAVLLQELRSTYRQPTEKFDGSTECFYNVDYEWLLSQIQELIKEHECL